MVQLMPLYPKTPSSLASFKSRLVLPFWYQLTQAHLEKRLLNGCSVVVVTKAVSIVDLMLLLLNCPINNFFLSRHCWELRTMTAMSVTTTHWPYPFLIHNQNPEDITTEQYQIVSKHINTHTHTRLTALCPGLPG